MKPDPTRLLEVAQSHLLAITAPAVTSGYERASLAVLSGMLGSVRRELLDRFEFPPITSIAHQRRQTSG